MYTVHKFPEMIVLYPERDVVMKDEPIVNKFKLISTDQIDILDVKCTLGKYYDNYFKYFASTRNKIPFSFQLHGRTHIINTTDVEWMEDHELTPAELIYLLEQNPDIELIKLRE